jgi:hypothetical protein
MNDPHQEFDFFMRRWQVRLFIAGFVLPPLLSAMACAIVSAAFLVTAGLLHGWRTAVAEQTSKARRKQRRANAATEAGH